MFTCFQGGVGHTLLGSHPWKTLSGCIQLDRNKFTCFLHSTDWSSTYIKDLNRVDFFSLGVSQHKSLILTLTTNQWFSIQALSLRPRRKKYMSDLVEPKSSLQKFPTDRTSSSHAAGPEGSFGLSLNTKAQTPKFVKRSSLVEDGSPKFRTSRKECSGPPTKAAHS